MKLSDILGEHEIKIDLEAAEHTIDGLIEVMENACSN